MTAQGALERLRDWRSRADFPGALELWARATAWGLSAGAAVGTLLAVADHISLQFDLTRPPWLDRAIPALFQVLADLLVRSFLGLADAGLLAFLPLLAAFALLAWPRTGRTVAKIFALAASTCAAWGASVVLVVGYTVSPDAGLLLASLSVPLAYGISRWLQLRAGALVVLAGGLPLAVLLPLMATDDRGVPLELLPDFVVGASAAFLVSIIAGRLGPVFVGSLARRFLLAWGPVSVCLAAFVSGLLVLRAMAPQEPAVARFLNDRAYDLLVIGNPAQLVWTDKDRTQVLTDVYGTEHETFELESVGDRYPQRLWRSAFGGFYVQTRKAFGWWPAPEEAERIATEPALRFRPILPNVGDWTAPDSCADDPVTRRVVCLSEWFSTYSVMARDTGSVTATGTLGNATWPYWQITPDLPRRRMFFASCLTDGNVHELDLDSMRIVQRASKLFAYKMVIDPGGRTLWAARPTTGEVVQLDASSFHVQRRVRVGWGVREVQRHPRTGDLYSCSFLDGQVVRIDPDLRSTQAMGHCGRSCRHMTIDPTHDVLWVATRDGICRFALPPEGADATP